MKLTEEKKPEKVTVRTLKNRGWRVDVDSGKWSDSEPCIELRAGSIIKGVPYDEARGLASANLIEREPLSDNTKPELLFVYDGKEAERKAQRRAERGITVPTGGKTTDQALAAKVGALEAQLAELKAKLDEFEVVEDAPPPAPADETKGKKK